MLTAQGGVTCIQRSAPVLERRGDPVGSVAMIMNLFVSRMGAVDRGAWCATASGSEGARSVDASELR